MEEKEVVYTNGIPQCPYCKKPTRRQGRGGTRTLCYYPPIFDENGNNTNTDKNIITDYYECLDCNKRYTTKGNSTYGYKYNL